MISFHFEICNLISICFYRPIRRAIELCFLLKALFAFFILVYIHVTFSQRPATCLESAKDKWPRDGVLRVEILRPISVDGVPVDRIDANASLLVDTNDMFHLRTTNSKDG